MSIVATRVSRLGDIVQGIWSLEELAPGAAPLMVSGLPPCQQSIEPVSTLPLRTCAALRLRFCKDVLHNNSRRIEAVTQIDQTIRSTLIDGVVNGEVAVQVAVT